MRIDVVSIFPEYLAPLDLSLPGKAQRRGLLELHVHDLRRWTSDRHRTVDDTPYGGGAGMVMQPGPWGEALDELADDRTVLVVPTPSGVRFSQPLAVELATEEHLLFACGRYEGIDQRVVEHAATRMRVVEVSLGDYVLNGGEVAAMAIVEAVVRLIPGFLGNAESLEEESHGADGLLEYPVYTKPVTWRGLDVPPVLLSGDHARVAQWRRAQALRRTAERRPDLLHASRLVAVDGVGEAQWRVAQRSDAGELMTLRRACGVEEGVASDERTTTFVVRVAGRLVGSVRTRLDGTGWLIDRLMAVPDLAGTGLARMLLEQAEAAAPDDVRTLSVVTGPEAGGELQQLFHRAGYRRERHQPDPTRARLSKRRRDRR